MYLRLRSVEDGEEAPCTTREILARRAGKTRRRTAERRRKTRRERKEGEREERRTGRGRQEAVPNRAEAGRAGCTERGSRGGEEGRKAQQEEER